MIRLDAASVLLQWATGGLFFLWVTTRLRLLGVGYGWLMRSTYLLMAVAAFGIGRRFDPVLVRDVCSALVALAAGVALFVSWQRRKAGVSGQLALHEERSERVAAMTGIERNVGHEPAEEAGNGPARGEGPEFPPALDLVAPAIGAVGLVSAGLAAGDPAALSVARMLVGAMFMGAVSDGMLLGHWYLVQPGLPRDPILELVKWTTLLWPFELAVMLWPTGMFSAINGTIDDGWQGLLTWFWVASSVTTLGLLIVTRLALRERAYSAVMAATGLLYLAILTAFGQDLVARAILSPGAG